MNVILENYQKLIIDATKEEKIIYLDRLKSEISKLENEKDKFTRFNFSRTNVAMGVFETFEVICFSDEFAILIEIDYDKNGAIVDCAVMEDMERLL